jgi:CelD/BcsL family acetyltransferase involved in cellulose biosynthesis
VTLAVIDDNTGAATQGAYRASRLAGLDDAFVRRLAPAAVTAFTTPGFLAALSATIVAEDGAELVMIGVTDEDDRPVALFPFSLRKQRGLRLIEGMGFGVSDYYAPILARGLELDAEATASLWRAVRAALPPADAIRLSNVPRILYGRPHALTGARFLGAMGHGATILPLESGGVRLALGELSVTRDVRRKAKKLAALGEVSLFEARTDAEMAELMDALVRFRRDRFAQVGRNDKLEEPGVEAFYRRLAADRVARAYGLRVGGDVVAVVYGLQHDGIFTLIIPTMSADERYRSGSPGLVSVYMAIEAAIAAGDRVFDFSVGDLFYKTRFAAEKLELLEHVQALSLRGLPFVLGVRLRTAARLFRQRHADLFAQLISLVRRKPTE